MPYIIQDARDDLDSQAREPDSAGELNYCLTQLCLSYFGRSAKNYQAINDIVGALEGCKLEFYRRLVADYEDSRRTRVSE